VLGLRGRKQTRLAGRLAAPINDRAIRAESGADIFAQGFENAPPVENVSGTFVDERKQVIELAFTVGGRRTML
jgi:hypothetical protein